MPTEVNLDALIPREDFEVLEGSGHSVATQTIQLMELERDRFLYPVLRKPDFQRETADWTPEKIADLVSSFLGGDLIPAVILWNSGRHLFVIDGSHRLSALIAWVHDDYGDGPKSREFFEQRIPDEQIEAAAKTRQLIKKRLGSYEDHKFAIANPERAKADVVDRARRLASLALQVQWVKGSAKQAEESFFKINQQAAPIDKTELRILRARRQPNALAARAIVRSGTGHKYWSSFAAETQQEIEATAREINDILFTPSLKTPIKTLDLPVAGRGYSSATLPLVIEFVDLANEILEKQPSDDATGEATALFLHKTLRLARRISGVHASSLGLHPAVYFYSTAGRYQPTAFLAVAGMVKELERSNQFEQFTSVRAPFEEFVLAHKHIANQITLKWGSGSKGFARLQEAYQTIFAMLLSGAKQSDIIAALPREPRFNFLKLEPEDDSPMRKDFTTDTKSQVFLRDALVNALRCRICHGYIHVNSITFDHILAKEDGGFGTPDNAQLAHPYCNSTYKRIVATA